MNLITISILIALSLAASIMYVSKPCFDKDSDKCRGYQFAEINKLKSASDCKYAGRPYFETAVSEEFMAGCWKYF